MFIIELAELQAAVRRAEEVIEQVSLRPQPVPGINGHRERVFDDSTDLSQQGQQLREASRLVIHLSTRHDASVVSDHRDVVVGAHCVQLCVKLSRADLELEVEDLIGRPVAKPLNFAVSIDLTTQAARSWLAPLSSFSREIHMLREHLAVPHDGQACRKAPDGWFSCAAADI